MQRQIGTVTNVLDPYPTNPGGNDAIGYLTYYFPSAVLGDGVLNLATNSYYAVGLTFSGIGWKDLTGEQAFSIWTIGSSNVISPGNKVMISIRQTASNPFTPYFTTLGPPLPCATFPPIKQDPLLLGSTGYSNPFSATAFINTSVITPGSTVA
jgi:hypothetical protein